MHNIQAKFLKTWQSRGDLEGDERSRTCREVPRWSPDSEKIFEACEILASGSSRGYGGMTYHWIAVKGESS